MRPGAQGSPGLPAKRAQGARPARPPAGRPDDAKRSTPPGAAQRIFWDWRRDGKAGPARPQLGRSDPRPAVSRRPLARPVPPSFLLPRLSQASLRRGAVASKRCSPPSSDSPLLPALEFSRLLISLASASLSPPPDPPAPGPASRPARSLENSWPPRRKVGRTPAGKGREARLGRAWG